MEDSLLSANTGAAALAVAGTALTVRGSRVANNPGGIRGSGPMLIEETAFLDNTATALYFSGGEADVDACRFEGNSDSAASAVFQNGGRVSIVGSVFSDNTATGNGGAIFAQSGETIVTDSLFIRNSGRSGIGDL